ncbi:MAG: alkaline phosphatase family protein [Phycisphaerales bacterium]|nr:MAG: alkaline phosphatase family protein [Phycisphaerales bacterium]
MLRRCVFLVAAAALSAGPVGAVAGADAPRNIVMFGWDGAQREHVQQCLGRGELPTLAKLIGEGKMVDIDIEGTTDTKAGWSQILTGYYPEVTGVYSNGRYQPIPVGLSIFERLEKHFGADKFVTVAVIGKKGHVGEINPPRKVRVNAGAAGRKQAAQAKKKAAQAKKKAAQPGFRNPRGKIIEEDGVKYRLIPGSPYVNMYKALDVWEFGLMQDEKVGSRAIELLDKYKDKPFFFFVHFAEVDHDGHKNGENSEAYNDALISNDVWTGKVIEKLKSLGLYDKTLIYVTADHGFNEDGKGHSFAPYVFLGTNDTKVNRNGRRQDVPATILARFGLDLSKLEPRLDGIPLDKPDNRPPAKIAPRQKAAKQAAKKKAPARGGGQRANRKKKQQ